MFYRLYIKGIKCTLMLFYQNNLSGINTSVYSTWSMTMPMFGPNFLLESLNLVLWQSNPSWDLNSQPPST